MAYPSDRVSLRALQNMLGRSGREAILPNLKIDHESFPSPIHFVADVIDLEARFYDQLLSPAQAACSNKSQWNVSTGVTTQVSSNRPPGAAASLRVTTKFASSTTSGISANESFLVPYTASGAKRVTAKAMLLMPAGQAFLFQVFGRRTTSSTTAKAGLQGTGTGAWQAITISLNLPPDPENDAYIRFGCSIYAVAASTSDADVSFNFSMPDVAAIGDFIAFPFEAGLPDDRDDQVPTATLTIDNSDRRLVPAIRDIRPPPPIVTLGLSMRSDPDNPVIVPLTFKMRQIDYDELKITATLSYQFKIDQKYPKFTITPATCPGLF